MPDPAPRTLAGIDISVLDNDVLTVAGLRADAASHPVTVDEQTVTELYTSAASAEVERLRTGVAELDDDSVLAQGHSAFVDAAAVLRSLAQRLGDTRPQAVRNATASPTSSPPTPARSSSPPTASP